MQQRDLKSRGFGYFVLVLSAIIWGAEGILAQLCYGAGFSLAGLLSMRYLSAIPAFALACKIFKAPLLPPKGVRLRLLGVSMFFIVGAFALYTALDLLPATLAILFFYAYPAFTSILCAATGRQRFDTPHVLALLVSAGGLLLLYWSSMTFISLVGLLCALLAAAMQSLKLVYSADLIEEIGVWNLNFCTNLLSAVVYTVYALAGGGGGFVVSATPQGWLYVLLLANLVTVLGSLFMYVGMHIVGAVDTSIICLLEPPTTAILAFLIFGDLLSGGQLFGGFLILIAVGLPPFYEVRKHKRMQKEQITE